MKIVEVRIADLKQGDTIINLRGDDTQTIGKDSVRYDPFLGWTLFGVCAFFWNKDSVKKIIYPKWNAEGMYYPE